MAENRAPTQPPTRHHLRLVQVATVVIVVGASAAAICFRDRLQELASYGYAAVFLISLVSNATIILPIPGLAVSSLMGGVFNPFIVGIVAGVGQALGEMSGYLVGYSGQSLADRGPTYDRISDWMSRHGVLTIFVLAVIPNPVFDLGGIAAGALRYPVWKFLLSCGAGKIAKNIIFALIGLYGTETILRLIQ